MERQFQGKCLKLDEAIGGHEVRLLFEDSWYRLHYRFFNCRNQICSETSVVVRTHLYNLAAALYRSYEILPELARKTEPDITAITTEVLEIAGYYRGFPLSLWISGDETSRESLAEKIAQLPGRYHLVDPAASMTLRQLRPQKRRRPGRCFRNIRAINLATTYSRGT